MKFRLKIMALVFILLALSFSLWAFLSYPYRQGEPFYMISGIFIAMSGYCWFGFRS